MPRLVPPALLALATAACSAPPAEDTDRPVEPRSAHALRDAMQAPLERAQDAQKATDDAETRRRALLDAAGG